MAVGVVVSGGMVVVRSGDLMVVMNIWLAYVAVSGRVLKVASLE